jgi:2-keto-4-pentenoate hydratase/2-oxohepta-3-ene-1,7-dioic acid hydratase in catechol pathway
MRLVTFIAPGGKERAGALIDADQTVVDLLSAAEALKAPDPGTFSSVLGIIEAGAPAMTATREIIERSAPSALIKRADVRLRAPIQPPPQMRDFSCFELHLQQSFASARRYRVMREPDPEAAFQALDTAADDKVIETFRRQPIYYKANRFAVIGADDDVIWPSYSRALDFELEWGCYIAKPAKDITADKADDYIFGYTIFNDVSARDAQALEMSGQLGPAKGKDFDTGNVMGPCLVTADEIPDPYNLTMIVRVNGEEWGRGNTGDALWTFEDVIAHVSRSETLHPGEFLGSGTVGNGSGLERMRNLKPNDVVELEVEKLGVLRTRFVKPAPAG